MKTKHKDEEKILQAARKKQIATYKETPKDLSPNFSAETLQTRSEWQDILKC